MSEKNKDDSSTRQITKGFLGGLEFGFLLYLCVLFLRVAINAVATGNAAEVVTLVPLYTEFGGFAIGFTGGIVKNL
jgi:hypothetical protein